MNNIVIQVQDGEKTLPCGAVYITEEILGVFKEIAGEENVSVKEI